MKKVSVTTTVDVDGTARTFHASAETNADPHRLADGLLSGLSQEASAWTITAGRDRRNGRAWAPASVEDADL